MIAALKYQTGRLTDLERQLRGDQAIGQTPNPVGTEIFAAHISPSNLLASFRREALNARLILT
jgi:hypothetical protein